MARAKPGVCSMKRYCYLPPDWMVINSKVTTSTVIMSPVPIYTPRYSYDILWLLDHDYMLFFNVSSSSSSSSFFCLFLLSFPEQVQMLLQLISGGTTPALPVLWLNGEKFQQLIKMVLYGVTQLLTRPYLVAV